MIRYKNFFQLIVCCFTALYVGGVQADTPHIAVSIHPLQLLAADLLDENVVIEQIMNTSDDPHHHNLTVSQLKKLDKADVIFWMGPELEVSLSKVLQGKARALALLPILVETELSKNSLTNGYFDEDLHLWMDPQYGLAIAIQITNELTRQWPQQSSVWQERLESFQQRTEITDNTISEYLLTSSATSFIASHNAFSHFAGRYGLTALGSLHDHAGVKVGPRTLTELLNQQHVDCVIAEPEYRDDARKMAARLGVTVIEIDPLGRNQAAASNAYQQFLLNVAEGFKACK